MEEQKRTGYPSIDKPWLKYYSEEAINAPLPESTIYEYLWENNKNFLDDIAIIYYNRKINYAELFHNIDRTAAALKACGVKKDEIVTVAMPSIPEALYVVYALNKIGAVANMIHPLAGEREICHYLNEVKSKVFLMFTGTYAIIKDSLSKTSVKCAVIVSPAESLSPLMKCVYKIKKKERAIERNVICMSWSSFLERGKNIKSEIVKKNCRDLALISHTGGTTGEPKGVMFSDYNVNAEIWQVGISFPHKRQERMLVVLPPFINYSLVNSMIEPLAFGLKVIIIPQYDPYAFNKYIKKYRPNYINSIPPYWEMLLNKKRTSKTNYSCLKYLFYGGEAMSPEIEMAVNDLLLSNGAQNPLFKGLGQTELVSATTATNSINNDLNSVGIPFVKINIKIVDPETTKELSFNQQGEICFSGPTLMLGYYNNIEETDAIVRIHADGFSWLHTGDLGYISEDGTVFVNGRLKRIIMTKGSDGIATKMFPDRIEKVLSQHPAISLCCVVGIKDEKRMHYPKAFVILNDGYVASNELTDEVRAFCNDKLPGYMIPDEIEYRVELPRTSRGKIDYRALEKETEET